MVNKSKSNIRLLSPSQETSKVTLRRLFEEHTSALRGFLNASLGGASDTDDIIQEIFIKLANLEGLEERLPPNDKRNRAFLFSMANNLLVDVRRNRQLREKYQDKILESSNQNYVNDSPESILLAENELKKIKLTLMKMKKPWREAFILNRFRYKTYREIAVDMNISVKTVEKYITKALIEIRKVIPEQQ
jgi:RNA polymerase sigma-70 factor (ECF subfamily)